MDQTETVIEKIAREKLWIHTLKTQNSDSADFHEVSVQRLKEALLAAYEAGRLDERSRRSKTSRPLVTK